MDQDLGSEEGEAELGGTLFGGGAKEHNLLVFLTFALQEPGVRWEFDDEAVPCSFNWFQSFLHDCPPRALKTAPSNAYPQMHDNRLDEL